MTHWTILIITILSGPLDGSRSTIAYASAEACHNATAAITVSIDGAYDFNIECLETGSVYLPDR